VHFVAAIALAERNLAENIRGMVAAEQQVVGE
jgi:hypothetical protein